MSEKLLYIEDGCYYISSDKETIRIPMETKYEFINKDGEKEVKVVKTKLDLEKIFSKKEEFVL